VLEIATTNWEVSRGPYASKFKTPAGKYVLLTISDNGSGMSPETKTHLFEPFYTTKEPGKGTGLGLAMVYGTIKKANGFIYADSEPGEGARFKIYLPAVDGAVQVQGKPTVAAGKGVRRKATILLVEDESNLRNLMAEFLSSGGHAVFTADGPENARKIALEQNGTIDVLLTDVVLKEGNGRQLAQQLSEAGCTFKVVYVSGYTPEAIIHRGILEPGIPFLQKPFGRQVLLDKIEEILVG
jgi:CheY-like chemotaxis protein